VIAFIEVTDVNGNPGYIKAENVEATAMEPDSGVTRVFVATGGFYRVQETQAEVLAKLRDIEAMKSLEGME
jgi:uncharacterized protein YlzI (FlbEa/FlbD family)